MKIAVAASLDDVNTGICPQFGRAPWFYIYDVKGDGEFVKNVNAEGGCSAGTDSVAFVADQRVSLVVAGRFGSKAMSLLREKGIQMVIPSKPISIAAFVDQIKRASIPSEVK